MPGDEVANAIIVVEIVVVGIKPVTATRRIADILTLNTLSFDFIEAI